MMSLCFELMFSKTALRWMTVIRLNTSVVSLVSKLKETLITRNTKEEQYNIVLSEQKTRFQRVVLFYLRAASYRQVNPQPTTDR